MQNDDWHILYIFVFVKQKLCLILFLQTYLINTLNFEDKMCIECRDKQNYRVILNQHTILKKELSQKCNQNICSFRKFYSQSKTVRYSHPSLVLNLDSHNYTERKHLIFKSSLHFYSWDNYTFHILIIKHLTMFIAIRN